MINVTKKSLLQQRRYNNVKAPLISNKTYDTLWNIYNDQGLLILIYELECENILVTSESQGSDSFLIFTMWAI